MVDKQINPTGGTWKIGQSQLGKQPNNMRGVFQQTTLLPSATHSLTQPVALCQVKLWNHRLLLTCNDKCENTGWETRKKKSETMVAPAETDARKSANYSEGNGLGKKKQRADAEQRDGPPDDITPKQILTADFENKLLFFFLNVGSHLNHLACCWMCTPPVRVCIFLYF